MKKVVCTFLAFLTIFLFSGCIDDTAYRVPEDCCIVSLPEGFEIWTKETYDKIDTPIKGIEREENKNYYSVPKYTSLTIINFESYIFDEGTFGTGKVVTGFKISDNVIAYSPSQYNDVTFSCSQNTDIEPIYQDFQSVGVVAFVGFNGENLFERVWSLDDCFNVDGTINETENFYYAVQFEKSEASIFNEFYWEINFDYWDVSFAADSVTYNINPVLTEEGQQVLYFILARYNETKYFVNSVALADKFPAAMAGMTVDIGKDFNLILRFAVK